MAIYDKPINSLAGEPANLAELKGRAVLVVNVASKCGLTPQYAGLQKLQDEYAGRGFTVLAVPCNQFMGQEPGAPEEIASFCSTNYGVTFPLTEKVEVNGDNKHPIFAELTQVADAKGEAGDVKWNFEKFLIAPDGDVVARFRPMTTPEDPELVQAIEQVLPG